MKLPRINDRITKKQALFADFGEHIAQDHPNTP
jgi:hypothetical protein